MKLTSENVDNIFRYCFCKSSDGEVADIPVDGVKLHVTFHPDKLKEKEADILEMLAQLPTEFMKTGGGGWTFLNMCVGKDGQQWAEHFNMDQLVTLGMAVQKVKFVFERDMWDVLPGGMPYILIEL